VPTLEELRAEDPARGRADRRRRRVPGAADLASLARALRLAHVIVVARPGTAFDGNLPPALAPEWSSAAGPRPRRSPPRRPARSCGSPSRPAISASAIRAASPARRGGGSRFAPARGFAYIERNRLYRRPGCDLTSSRRPPSPLSKTSRRATSPSSMSASSQPVRHADRRQCRVLPAVKALGGTSATS